MPTQGAQEEIVSNHLAVETAVKLLQDTFGEDISYTLRLPKSGDDILIRSEVPVMNNNAATGERKSIVRVSDSDRQNPTTHQLALCLGNLSMKMEGGALYIKTQSPILVVDSAIDDTAIQKFVNNSSTPTEKTIATSAEDEEFMKEFFSVAKEDMQHIQDRLFVRPLVEDRALKDILAHNTIEDPLAASYRGLFMGGGAYVFPRYTKNNGITKGQLIVSTDNTLVI